MDVYQKGLKKKAPEVATQIFKEKVLSDAEKEKALKIKEREYYVRDLMQTKEFHAKMLKMNTIPFINTSFFLRDFNEFRISQSATVLTGLLNKSSTVG